MIIQIPNFSLVVLIGVAGSGKSTFAKNNFLSTEVIASDFCRALITDDEDDQTVNPEAFSLLHTILDLRLARKRLCVADATNLLPEARQPLLALARKHHCPACAIVFNLPEQVCQAQNLRRRDRTVEPIVIQQQCLELQKTIKRLNQEGFRSVFMLESHASVAESKIIHQG
jgi:protein phosphatase